MAIHVAILLPRYLQAILDGRKTIESRLSKVMGPPHGMVLPGERLFFKQSGGPFLATALAGEVLDFTDLTPQRVVELEQRYRPAIGGDDDYWQAKRAAAFATFIRLRGVEPFDRGPDFRPINMKAWHVLSDAQQILFEHTLTQGNVRNRHVLLPAPEQALECLPPKRRDRNHPPTPAAPDLITLHLPDGAVIATDLARGRMLRWRGWGRYFEAFACRAGDRVRFVAVGRHEYRVTFRPALATAVPCPPPPTPAPTSVLSSTTTS